MYYANYRYSGNSVRAIYLCPNRLSESVIRVRRTTILRRKPFLDKRAGEQSAFCGRPTVTEFLLIRARDDFDVFLI